MVKVEMKIFIFLCAALALASAAKLRDGLLFNGEVPTGDSMWNKNDKIIEGVYRSPLDPFSPTNSRLLKLHYAVNVEFFQQGGPLFLQTHFDDGFGEANLHRHGLMYSLAREKNGALIRAHFRYMGNNYLGYDG